MILKFQCDFRKNIIYESVNKLSMSDKDSEIEGNHWYSDTESDISKQQPDFEPVDEEKAKRIVTAIKVILGFMLISGMFVAPFIVGDIDISSTGESNLTQVSTVTESDELIVKISNVHPSNDYVIVETNTSKKFVYSDRSVSFDREEIRSITVIGVHQEDELYETGETTETLLYQDSFE